MENIIPRFRKVALAEGVSYLAIFFISMPLKYGFEIAWPNKVIGMIHGILFMAYIVTAVPLFTKLYWDTDERLLPVCLAAIIPFGTFWLERKYLR